MRRDSRNTASVAKRGDWKSEPMPEQHTTFVLDRSFSDAQMEALRRGNVPKAMEDKWFWFMEGSSLWAHRSWTGHCIYQIDFKEDNHHLVAVNRDPEQYKCTSVEEDIESLNKLLDQWTRGSYDYYNQWLSETYAALTKARVKLVPLEPADREQFIRDSRQACPSLENSEAYWIVWEDQKLGGIVLSTDREEKKGVLELLFVNPDHQGEGIGQAAWRSARRRHPEILTWETKTSDADAF